MAISDLLFSPKFSTVYVTILILSWRPYFLFHQRDRSSQRRYSASSSHSTHLLTLFFLSPHILFSFLLVDIKTHVPSPCKRPTSICIPSCLFKDLIPEFPSLFYILSSLRASFSLAHTYAGPACILILLPIELPLHFSPSFYHKHYFVLVFFILKLLRLWGVGAITVYQC